MEVLLHLVNESHWNLWHLWHLWLYYKEGLKWLKWGRTIWHNASCHWTLPLSLLHCYNHEYRTSWFNMPVLKWGGNDVAIAKMVTNIICLLTTVLCVVEANYCHVVPHHLLSDHPLVFLGHTTGYFSIATVFLWRHITSLRRPCSLVRKKFK